MTGQADHLTVLFLFPDPMDQLHAGFSWHFNIRKQNIDFFLKKNQSEKDL